MKLSCKLDNTLCQRPSVFPHTKHTPSTRVRKFDKTKFYLVVDHQLVEDRSLSYGVTGPVVLIVQSRMDGQEMPQWTAASLCDPNELLHHSTGTCGRGRPVTAL